MCQKHGVADESLTTGTRCWTLGPLGSPRSKEQARVSFEESTLLDTLSLSPRERERVINSMNQMAAKPLATGCRRRLRVDFDHAPAVVLKMLEDNGTDLRFSCQPRNLSRWGVAVIHGRFLYPDKVCLVALPTLDKRYTVHQAVVRQCRHVKGTVHEVSLVFAEPIALGDYVVLTDEQRSVAAYEAQADEEARLREQCR